MPPSLLRARLLILGAAFFWSLGGLGIKTCGFGAMQTSGMRCLFAAMALFLILPEARRHWSWKALAVAGMNCASMVLFVIANKTTTAANAIFLQSSFPLWVMVFSAALLQEKPTRRDYGMTIVFAAGLACFFFSPEKATALSPKILLGNAIALLSGLTVALMIIGFRSLRQGGAVTAVAMGNSLAAAICLPAAALGLGGEWIAGTPLDWFTAAWLGVIQIGGGYLLYTRGLRTLRAMEASLIGLIEPVLNPIWVFLVFQSERPGPWALVGGAIILAATAAQVLNKAPAPQNTLETERNPK